MAANKTRPAKKKAVAKEPKEAKTDQCHFRITEREKARIFTLAKRLKMNVSDLMFKGLDAIEELERIVLPKQHVQFIAQCKSLFDQILSVIVLPPTLKKDIASLLIALEKALNQNSDSSSDTQDEEEVDAERIVNELNQITQYSARTNEILSKQLTHQSLKDMMYLQTSIQENVSYILKLLNS